MSKGGGTSIPSDYTMKIGSDGSTIHVDTDLDNIHIKEIAPVTVNSNVAVTQPIVTQSTSKSDSAASLDLKVEPLDLKIEPIKADVGTNSVIDLKPVAVDSCTTIKLAPLLPLVGRLPGGSGGRPRPVRTFILQPLDLRCPSGRPRPRIWPGSTWPRQAGLRRLDVGLGHVHDLLQPSINLTGRA